MHPASVTGPLALLGVSQWKPRIRAMCGLVAWFANSSLPHYGGAYLSSCDAVHLLLSCTTYRYAAGLSFEEHIYITRGPHVFCMQSAATCDSKNTSHVMIVYTFAFPTPSTCLNSPQSPTYASTWYIRRRPGAGLMHLAVTAATVTEWPSTSAALSYSALNLWHLQSALATSCTQHTTRVRM